MGNFLLREEPYQTAVRTFGPGQFPEPLKPPSSYPIKWNERFISNGMIFRTILNNLRSGAVIPSILSISIITWIFGKAAPWAITYKDLAHSNEAQQIFYKLQLAIELDKENVAQNKLGLAVSQNKYETLSPLLSIIHPINFELALEYVQNIPQRMNDLQVNGKTFAESKVIAESECHRKLKRLHRPKRNLYGLHGATSGGSAGSQGSSSHGHH